MELALGVVGTCWAYVSCASFRRREAHTAGEVALLTADLAKLDRPAYSEDGVPVLLVGESLTAGRANPQSADGPGLAAEFRKIADLFLEAHPAATPSDIPKLVELLALRDFGDLANSKINERHDAF